MKNTLGRSAMEQADPRGPAAVPFLQPADWESGGTPPYPLTAVEIAEFDICEARIERGLQTFIDVGMALGTIQSRQLFRGAYSSFEVYLEERWGFSARHARRLITGSEIAGNLIGFPIKPISESQVRPLAGLPAEEQRAVWKEATATAPHGRVTAKHVAALVESLNDARQRVPTGRADLPVRFPEERRRALAERALAALEELAALPAIAGEDGDLREAIEIVERQIPLCNRLDEMQRARLEAQRG